MPAHTKRRRIPRYISFPVVVAVSFLIVAKLVAMQRADIIADLAHRAAHRDTVDASAAVRQLAAMSRPPIDILVEAATSGDQEVSDEAKQAISKLLRRCERQLEADEHEKRVSRQLAELAEALAAQCKEFSTLDREWLANTTQKILRLANLVPPKHSPLLATHCDTILTSIDAKTSTDIKQVHHRPNAGQIVRNNNDVTDANPDDGETNDASSRDATLNEPIDASWRSGWANPIFRILPTKPIDAAPIQRGTIAPEQSSPMENREPSHLDSIDSPLAKVDSGTLLQHWLAAKDGNTKSSLEQELAQRGFRRLSEPLVRRFFSNRPTERLQFVDDVLAEPGVDVRPWLMLLAEDKDADVRLAAVTIMATSNDAALVEKAWQAAIHDRDPRIASLAERLRERRAATQRR